MNALGERYGCCDSFSCLMREESEMPEILEN
jgi:hypothetical protein